MVWLSILPSSRLANLPSYLRLHDLRLTTPFHRHAGFDGGGDVFDEHAEAGSCGDTPEDEGRETEVEGQVGEDVNPVVARTDDLGVVVGETGFDDGRDVTADVVDAANGG